MLAALTGIGLSAAAGLNAYIPFLIVAGLARFTDVLTLPTEYAWMESWWALGIGTTLLLIEVVVDKVPAIDTINDAVQTYIRPSMGGLMVAATTAASSYDNSTWMQQHQWVGILLGVVVSGLVHSGKAVARPVVGASTLGLGTPIVSAAEDGASLGIALIAVFVPILVILVVIGLVLLFFLVLSRLQRWWTRRRAPSARPRDSRVAP